MSTKLKYVPVNPNLHASLKAEAARAGISLQEYVQRILTTRNKEAAACPH